MTTVDMCHCTCTGGFAACHTHEDGVVIQPSHSEGEAGLRCSDCGNYLEDYDGPCSNPTCQLDSGLCNPFLEVYHCEHWWDGGRCCECGYLGSDDDFAC